MRKFLLTSAVAAAAMSGLLVWNAQAQTWRGDALKAETQNFSAIEKASCRGPGGHCGWGWTWYCGPRGWCRCVRC
jgi:hypothetical protein